MITGKAGLRSTMAALRKLSLLGAALALCACPNQELASLKPCTVSGVSVDATSGGVNKVDLLFVIDNSGSMAEEQVKLNQQLTRLVRVLTTGNYDGATKPNGSTDFPPVASLHLGVVSTDLGLNGQPPLPNATSCLVPTGDEGRLLSSGAIAAQGFGTVAGRPECASVNVPRFLDFTAKASQPETIAQQFSCIASLGTKGCGIEQQLESMWRALAPSTDRSFSRGAGGQGAPMGQNAGFVRDDAVLAVIVVSDEEDCSAPDAASAIVHKLDTPRDPMTNSNPVNVLCTRNADKLHSAARYVQGLKALKPLNEERVIFAGIVGVPTSARTKGLSMDQILALPEMQVKEEIQGPMGNLSSVNVPACKTASAGDATPARRIVEVAKGFGKNGVITSICEDDYGPALSAVIEKIAEQLEGKCLPRKLERNATTSKVECSVVEIKEPNDRKPCAGMPGRLVQLQDRELNGDGKKHIVCELEQLPVTGRTAPTGSGWYYDDFSSESQKCGGARIAIATSSPLSPGALAKFECFRTVADVESGEVRGVLAVNTPCSDDGTGAPSGDAKCSMLELPEEPLLCIAGACQLSCSNDAACQPGFSCVLEATGRGHCENPTCPVSQ